MQRLEVSCAVRRFFKSLGFRGLSAVLDTEICKPDSTHTATNYAVNIICTSQLAKSGFESR